jgi:hypothetical protein
LLFVWKLYINHLIMCDAIRFPQIYEIKF